MQSLVLAGNILQFMQFAAALLNTAKTIHLPASEGSEALRGLDNLGETLSQFSHDLAEDPGMAESPKQHRVNLELRRVAASCKDDCDLLIKLTTKMQERDRAKSHLPGSLGDVVMELLSEKCCEELSQRINQTQSTVVLLICTIFSDRIGNLQDRLTELKSRSAQINMTRTFELEHIATQLSRLHSEIENMGATKNTDTVRLGDISTIWNSVMDLSHASDEYAKEQAILSSLDYDRRPARHEAIPVAHKNTFNWVFMDRSPSAKSRLSQWLEKGHGAFWVSGKPGAGKSTLMKFVADDDRTMNLISAWAYPRKACIANHYFWGAGTAMQRSQAGLFQSLLFDLLRQIPDLIRPVCAGAWERELSELQRYTWSESELMECLGKIAQEQTLDTCFCFFIDGLDEFDGNHRDLSETLTNLSASKHIKVCVSSRPWDAFVDTFGQSTQRIAVHELTRDDIHCYVQSQLRNHPNWVCIPNGSEACAQISRRVSELAEGVFLWVFLVTRNLREGLDSQENVSDLTNRLNSIPVELGKFLQKILTSRNVLHHSHMARMLAIANMAIEPLPPMIYALQKAEMEDDDYAIKLPIKAFSEEKVALMLENVHGWLRERCNGLLEINNGAVQFLHRTVRDYLRTAEMMTFISENLGPKNFIPSLSIVRAHVAWIKGSTTSEMRRQVKANFNAPAPNDLTSQAIRYASMSEDEDFLATERAMDEVELSLRTVFRRPDPEPVPDVQIFPMDVMHFRKRLLTFDACWYISKKLCETPEYFREFRIQQLDTLLQVHKHDRGGELSPKRLQTVEAFLKQGLSRDECLDDGQTHWTKLMTRVLDGLRGSTRTCTTASDMRLISLFLQYGEDPNTLLSRGGQPIWVALLDAGLVAACYSVVVPRRLNVDHLIQILEAMMIHGADFGLLKGKTKVGSWEMTYAEVFGSRLKNACREAHMLAHHQRQLLAQILKLVATYEPGQGFPWASFGSSLQECLPSTAVNTILAATNKDAPLEQCQRKETQKSPLKRQLNVSDLHQSSGQLECKQHRMQ